MSYTIDCGEGRHTPTCIGYGDETYLVPQLTGEQFTCACWCHDAPTVQSSTIPTSSYYGRVHWMPEDDPNY